MLIILPILFFTVASNTPVMAQSAEIRYVYVTNNQDSGPGSLRDALEKQQPGDVIRFSTQVFTRDLPVVINLKSALPGINVNFITIDASDAGVILDGSLLPPETNGLVILSSNNRIMGLQILNFPGDGIVILDGASKNTIGGNQKGEGNTIGGNGKNGIFLLGAGTDNNRIIGNHIGTDPQGLSPLPNGMHGINIMDGPEGNIIGGEMDSEGNLISGNLSAGILIQKVEGTIIQGNIIGLDAALKSTIPNATCGIVLIESTGTLVGGSTSKVGNIIGGNLVGIHVWTNARENVIAGNLIGYKQFAGNLNEGIWLFDGAYNNTIGPENTIAFSGNSGIRIEGKETRNNTITQNNIYENKDVPILYADYDEGDLPSATLLTATSRSVSGTATAGTRVEIYSDLNHEARFYEGNTTADNMGKFSFSPTSGSFKGKNISAMAIYPGGPSSALSQSLKNPGYGVISELPNIPSPKQVSTDPVVVGTNIFVALFSVVFFGFTTSVFNNLVKNLRLKATAFWNRIVPKKAARVLSSEKPVELGRPLVSRFRFLLTWAGILFINATIESFLDPSVSFLDVNRIRLIAGMLLAGLLASSLEWGIDALIHKRLSDRLLVRAELRWFGLIVSMASVVFSRLVHFTPGYILGTMGTVIVLPKILDPLRSGKRSGIMLSAIFGIGLVLWLVSSVLPPQIAWLESLLLNVFLIILSGVLFELLPLDIFDGSSLWKWRKGFWFLLFFPVFFTFTHLFLNPSGSSVQSLQQNSMRTLLAVMAVYGAATLILWLIFRKKQPAT